MRLDISRLVVIVFLMNLLKKNLIYSFSSQGLQFLQSVLMSLLIPKILGIEEFGFWQLFIFYTQYGGFFHLGFNDGVTLKIGGKYYDSLNFSSLGVQLRLSILFQILLLLPFLFLGILGVSSQRIFIAIFSCIFILVNNFSAFLAYVLQATNRIKEYSYSRAIDTMCFLFILSGLLINRVADFRFYVLVYLLGRLVGLTYCALKAKKIVYSFIFQRCNKEYFYHFILNIRNGLSLVFANIASMLILGYGRYIVDKVYGIESFSKISFMIMISNFFLTFLNQASLVLFPDLRRRDFVQQCSFYEKVSRSLFSVAPLFLLVYFPIALILPVWLPDYSDSLTYLLFLLPLCFFDGKMQLLGNTMFKVINNMKGLLVCNIFALCLSIVFVTISVYILDNILFSVVSMLFAIMVRGYVADYILRKKSNIHNNYKQIIQELGIVLLFWIVSWLFPKHVAFLCFAFISIPYSIFKLKKQFI